MEWSGKGGKWEGKEMKKFDFFLRVKKKEKCYEKEGEKGEGEGGRGKGKGRS